MFEFIKKNLKTIIMILGISIDPRPYLSFYKHIPIQLPTSSRHATEPQMRPVGQFTSSNVPPMGQFENVFTDDESSTNYRYGKTQISKEVRSELVNEHSNQPHYEANI